MTELRYNRELTYSEYRIAVSDELDLEKSVLEHQQSGEEWKEKVIEAEKFALREIDRLKVAGRYEAERGRLATKIQPSPELARFAERYASGEFDPLENLLAGLKSPDAEQRARFMSLFRKEFRNKTPRDTWHILLCLEQAKKPKGRPGISPPWRNVAEQLDSMRISISEGLSIPEAVRVAAHQEGQAHHENRAKYFEGLYRERVALRE